MDAWENITYTSGDFKVTSGLGGTGYYIVVARNATAPTEAQVGAGVNYSGVTVITSGSGPVVADVERIFSISGLTAGTAYDFWFVVQDAENEYGRLVRSPFQTLSYTVPELATTAASDITGNTALSGGNVTDGGGLGVTGRGVVWSTSSSPTLGSHPGGGYTEDGAGMGIYSSSLTGLLPSTLYYVRAYAENAEGVGYGNQITFTTLDKGPPAMVFPPLLQEQGTPLPAAGKITDGVAGVLLREIRVLFYDQFGNTVAAGHEIAGTINKATFASGSTLSAVTDVDGVATFNNLTVEHADQGYEITFSVIGADPAVFVTSDTFDVMPAAAHAFVFTVSPATTGAGEPTSFTIQTVDAFGNVTVDHSGFTDILLVTGDSAFAARHQQVDFPVPPMGADPFDPAPATHSFDICYRLAGIYTQTVSAAGMTAAEHEITVEPTILWKTITNTSVSYMADYYQVLYAYNPVTGPILDFSGDGLPPGLSISTSFDLIDTIAGNGALDYDAADENGAALEAAIGDPQGIAVTADGVVYMTDSWNGRVWKRTADGTISTILDLSGDFGAPFGIAINDDLVFVTDAGNSKLYALDRGNSYAASVLVDDDDLFSPFGLALDGDKLYIADTYSQQIKLYDLDTATLTVFAGTGAAGYNDDGIAAVDAQLNFPEDVAVDADGNVYIADTDNHRVRKVDVGTGVITTIAGTGDSGFSGDGGLATAARLQGSAGIAVDTAGRILISDTQNNRLRLIRQNGNIETIAGGNSSGFSGDGGDASDARMQNPTGITVGPDMSIYIADAGNGRVRQVYLSVAILSGNPEDVNRDGNGNLIPYSVTLNANPGHGCGVDYLFELDVQPKELSVINAVAADKTYDATTTASVSGATLSGIESPGGSLDDVALTSASTGVFAQTGQGAGIVVTTAMDLTGDDAYRYTVAQPDYLAADINLRAVTYVVTAGQTKVYGNPDDNADLTGAVDIGAGDGLVAGHAFTTGALVREVGEDVGDYAVGQGNLAIRDGDLNDLTANYNVTFTGDNFTIAPRELSIIATGATKVYGDGDPAFPRNNPVLQFADEFVGALSREPGENVGEYDFLIGTLSIEDGADRDVAANYSITFDGTAHPFSITPAMLTVTADDDDKAYDGVPYAGGNGVVFSGFKFEDDASVLGGELVFGGNSQGAVDFGTYVITPSGYTSGNYNFTYLNGTLDIFKADQEIIYTPVAAPVEWKDVVTLQANIESSSGPGSTSDIVFDASVPGFVAGDQLTFNMRGPVSIEVSLDGDLNYHAADGVSQDILVLAEPIWESTPVTTGTVSVEYSYQLEVSDLDGWRWDLAIAAVDPSTPDWLSIRHATDERRIHLFAGTGVAGTNDGANVTGANFPAHTAAFNRPYGVAIASDMTVYVADRDNHVIRRIHPWGSVDVLAGTMGINGFAGDDDQAAAALLNAPRGVALSEDETVIYIADSQNHRVRKVDLATGIISTVAGNGIAIGAVADNVDATTSRVAAPQSIIERDGYLYIAATVQNRIRRVDLETGIITTLIGSGLNAPTGLFLDGSDLYVADQGNHRIAKFDLLNSTLSNVAGTPGTLGFAGDDGPATAALLNQPFGVAVESGILYITDANNNRIRTVDLANSIITTFAGDGTEHYFGDNDPVADAQLDGPRGIVSDGHGHLFFADMNNNRIRRIDNGTFYLEGISYVAGDYDVMLTAEDSSFATEQVFTITIDTFVPVIDTWPVAGGMTYGDLLGMSELTGGAAHNGQGDPVPGVFAWDDESALLPHGTHTPSLTFTPSDTNNYECVTGAAVEVFVARKDLTVTAVPFTNSIIYGADAPSVSVQYDGFVDGEDESALSNMGFELGTNYTPGDPIGNYATTIAVGTAAADNYTFVLETESFEVTVRELTVAGALALDKAYDGNTSAVVNFSGASLPELLVADAGQVTLVTNDYTASFASANAGVHDVTVSGLDITGDKASNYTLVQPVLSATIQPAPQTITFETIGTQFWTNNTPLSASATSGLGVQFEVLSGSANLAGPASLIFSGYGEVTIEATQIGNANWAAADPVTRSFLVVGPELSVLGTNAAVVASSNAVSVADGTDFGAALMGLDTVTHVFVVTNAGTDLLTFSGVETNGAQAASFTLIDLPETLAVGETNTFSIVFDPQEGGLNEASFVLQFDGTNSPYTVFVAGAGLDGDISFSASELSFAGVYASDSPDMQSLYLINVGVTDFTWSHSVAYGSGATGWLNITPETGTLGGGDSIAIENAVDLTGIPAGTYVATNSFWAVDATNAPQAYVVRLTVDKADQTVSFTQLAPQVWTATNTLLATATSGMDVTFEVIGGPGSLTGLANLEYTDAGNVLVAARQAGDDNWHAAPAVTNVVKVFRVTPDNGPLAGDNVVTVTNGYFGTVTNVVVGESSASILLASNTWFDITMPAATNAGLVDIVVQTSDKGDITLSGAYTYNPVGTITNVAPASGSWTGGFHVVISGENLSDESDWSDITNVTLAGISVSDIVSATATQIVVTAGSALSAGIGDVVVHSRAYGEAVAPDAFAYLRAGQEPLVFNPDSPQAFGSVNALSVSGGSGTGAVHYAVIDGPGVIVGDTNLEITAGSGIVTVVVTQEQDDLYFEASATATVSVAKAPQIITNILPSSDLAFDIEGALNLSAESTSGMDVEFAVASGPGMISGGTHLTFTGVGEVTVVATQDGDDNWLAAPAVQRTFRVWSGPATAVYRFWSDLYRNHFYTVSEAEKDRIIATMQDVWTFEGIAFYVHMQPVEGSLPVHRFWLNRQQSHLYSISAEEKDELESSFPNAFTYEGVAWHAFNHQAFGTLPVYRFWSPQRRTLFFTMSESEKDHVIATMSRHWRYEGVAWYAYPSRSAMVASSTGSHPFKANETEASQYLAVASCSASVVFNLSYDRNTVVEAVMYDPEEDEFSLVLEPTLSPMQLLVPSLPLGRRYWLSVLSHDSGDLDKTLDYGGWIGRVDDLPKEDVQTVAADDLPMDLPFEYIALPEFEGGVRIDLYCGKEGDLVYTQEVEAGETRYALEVPAWNQWYRLEIHDKASGLLLQSTWIGHHRTH